MAAAAKKTAAKKTAAKKAAAKKTETFRPVTASGLEGPTTADLNPAFTAPTE